MNKAKRFFMVSGLLIATCFLTGCSGINYTHGVSPATFLLPGLVNNEKVDGKAQDLHENPPVVLVTQNF